MSQICGQYRKAAGIIEALSDRLRFPLPHQTASLLRPSIGAMHIADYVAIGTLIILILCAVDGCIWRAGAFDLVYAVAACVSRHQNGFQVGLSVNFR